MITAWFWCLRSDIFQNSLENILLGKGEASCTPPLPLCLALELIQLYLSVDDITSGGTDNWCGQ